MATIRVFSAERPRLTVSEIAEATGLTRAAARRFVLALTELGYVRLAILNGDEVVYTLRVPTNKVLSRTMSDTSWLQTGLQRVLPKDAVGRLG